MKLLLVKMSSLGDVVHALPAVTDAAGAHRDLEVHWVVEEGFAAIPALHRAVTRVVPVALRRWRRRWRDAAKELRACVASLRRERYDVVLDSQGLIKSAAVARVCRGPRVGFDAQSARERLACVGYDRGIAVARGRHAIDRQRALFAGALGYPMPASNIDYGVTTPRSQGTGMVFAHGTSWPNKQWPETYWQELARRAAEVGAPVTLLWGNDVERARAQRIAAAGATAKVAPRLDLRGVIDLLGRSSMVIGVDSGIAHLATALGVPTIAIYGPTDAALTGCRGESATDLTAEFACAPCRARRCGYDGAPVLAAGRRIEPPCFAAITPERVWQCARETVRCA